MCPRLPRVARLVVMIAVISAVSACGVAPRAVVVDRGPSGRDVSRPATPPSSGSVHVVQRGDTLYSIAFRHGLEYRQVAAWNGISAPFTIYPGQRLRLGPPPRAAAPQRPAQTAGNAAGRPAPVTDGQPATGAGGTRAPSSPASPTRTPAADKPATPVVNAPTPAPATPTTPTPANAGAPRWQWPTSGQVVGRFVAGDPTRQGLSIAGSAGQPVLAAADGVIVYSGSGLIGYGELIIVKHNDEFLSAYGHNRKRLVAEGEQVRGGQQIAEMGRSGAARDMLHFEIRRNGRPVDPAGFLPAR